MSISKCCPCRTRGGVRCMSADLRSTVASESGLATLRVSGPFPGVWRGCAPRCTASAAVFPTLPLRRVRALARACARACVHHTSATVNHGGPDACLASKHFSSRGDDWIVLRATRVCRPQAVPKDGEATGAESEAAYKKMPDASASSRADDR